VTTADSVLNVAFLRKQGVCAQSARSTNDTDKNPTAIGIVGIVIAVTTAVVVLLAIALLLLLKLVLLRKE
jgi:hypothetical protein